MIDPANFRQVLGSYPTGVCAITARGPDATPLALIVGSFTSVSLDPPLVGFFPAKSSTSWVQIEPVGQFCVNVLGADQDGICRQLAGGGQDKFDGIAIGTNAHGSPTINGAIAQIDCTLYSVTDAGDHRFVLGKVDTLDVLREAPPLLFFKGQYGGFSALPPASGA